MSRAKQLALPDPDAKGNFPAVEYARVSLPREIIRSQRGVGTEPTATGDEGRHSGRNALPDRNRQDHPENPDRRENRMDRSCEARLRHQDRRTPGPEKGDASNIQ